MLLRTPVFTLVIIFTLAVGIGANTAMFSVVNAVLLQALPFRDAHRIVDLNEVEKRDRSRGAIAAPNFLDWRAQAQSFDAMSVYAVRNMNVASAGGEPERLPGAFTSTSFFDVLGVRTDPRPRVRASRGRARAGERGRSRLRALATALRWGADGDRPDASHQRRAPLPSLA